MQPERSKATFSMPLAFARSAMARPTALAASMLPVAFNSPRPSFCKVEAATRTLSPSGAMICAYMCCGVRCTDRRIAANSLILTRPRSARRKRVACLVSFMITFLFLLLRFFQRNFFVGILHALALVGLRRPEAADLRRGLADALTVDALDDDLGLARRLDGDALGDREIDQMRITQGQGQVLALNR